MGSLTRRNIIRYGFGGAVVLGVAGFGIGLRPSVEVVAPRALQVLTPTLYSVVHAIAEIVVPQQGKFPAPSEVEVAMKVDDYLARSPQGMQQEFCQLLSLVENALAGLIFDGRPRTFTVSSTKEQRAKLEAWRRSSLQVRRTGYRAIQSLIGAVYYDDPRCNDAINYPGPPAFFVAPEKDSN